MPNTRRTPELRFPGFGGEWEVVRAAEIFDNRKERGNADLRIYSITQDQGYVPRDTLDREFRSNAGPETNLRAYKGDLAYNMMRMWQGAVSEADADGMISPAYIVLAPKEDVCSTFYLYLFDNTRYLYKLWAYSHGLTKDRLRLYFSDFSQIRLPLPSLPEQQKIVAFLRAVDARAALLRRQVAALQAYKRGVMQRIFDREVRFGAGEWEKYTLGSITKWSSGGTPSKKRSDYWEGDIPWISASSMHAYDLNNSDLKITEKAVSDGAKLVHAGTLLLLVRGSMLYKRIPLGITTRTVAFNQDVKALKVDESVTSPTFLMHWFQANENNLLNMVLTTGMGAGKLDTDDLQSLDISLPPLAEQRRITAFLGALDARVARVQRALEGVEVFRRGVLGVVFV